MMPQTQTKPSPVAKRHQRQANKKVAAPHKPGTPPNLCLVATADELTYINALGWGKAAAVHSALRLLREVQAGSIKLADPMPDYVTTPPTPKSKNANPS